MIISNVPLFLSQNVHVEYHLILTALWEDTGFFFFFWEGTIFNHHFINVDIETQRAEVIRLMSQSWETIGPEFEPKQFADNWN